MARRQECVSFAFPPLLSGVEFLSDIASTIRGDGRYDIAARPLTAACSPPEEFMLDLVYVISAVGLFALIALVARGVERL